MRLEISLPHCGQVAPKSGHQNCGDECEGDEVKQSRLGRVHEKQGDEGGDETEDVGDAGDGPVEAVPVAAEKIETGTKCVENWMLIELVVTSHLWQ